MDNITTLNAYDNGEWVYLRNLNRPLNELCGDKLKVLIHYFDGHNEIHDGQFIGDGLLIPTAGNPIRNRFKVSKVKKLNV